MVLGGEDGFGEPYVLGVMLEERRVAKTAYFLL